MNACHGQRGPANIIHMMKGNERERPSRGEALSPRALRVGNSSSTDSLIGALQVALAAAVFERLAVVRTRPESALAFLVAAKRVI